MYLPPLLMTSPHLAINAYYNILFVPSTIFTRGPLSLSTSPNQAKQTKQRSLIYNFLLSVKGRVQKKKKLGIFPTIGRPPPSTLYYISRPCRCLLGALSKLARVSFDWITQFLLDINCFPWQNQFTFQTPHSWILSVQPGPMWETQHGWI